MENIFCIPKRLPLRLLIRTACLVNINFNSFICFLVVIEELKELTNEASISEKKFLYSDKRSDTIKL
jgi:hypothetical protein